MKENDDIWWKEIIIILDQHYYIQVNSIVHKREHPLRLLIIGVGSSFHITPEEVAGLQANVPFNLT